MTDWAVGSRDLVSGGGASVCASDHSLAATISLDIVEVGVKDMFSKIRRFLKVYIAHTIHMNILKDIPKGGSLIA